MGKENKKENDENWYLFSIKSANPRLCLQRLKDTWSNTKDDTAEANGK